MNKFVIACFKVKLLLTVNIIISEKTLLWITFATISQNCEQTSPWRRLWWWRPGDPGQVCWQLQPCTGLPWSWWRHSWCRWRPWSWWRQPCWKWGSPWCPIVRRRDTGKGTTLLPPHTFLKGFLSGLSQQRPTWMRVVRKMAKLWTQEILELELLNQLNKIALTLIIGVAT